MSIMDLARSFFTHKDYLPSPEYIPGTLFTPLQILSELLFAGIVAVIVILFSKKKESDVRKFLMFAWLLTLILEPIIVCYEAFAGKDIDFNLTGNLSLYPCSLFLFAMPFAIWGKSKIRYAACGYVCTLGLLGGIVNFVYPVNVMSTYSAFSFAGFHTQFYHSTIVCCAILMLITRYHTFAEAKQWKDLLLPLIPCLVFSIPAHIVNFTIDADYMFFRLRSFFFAPLGEMLPTVICVFIVYIIYAVIHIVPYLPGYFKNKNR